MNSKESKAEFYKRAIENLGRKQPGCVVRELIVPEETCVGYGSYSSFVTEETYRQAKPHPLKKLFSFLFSYAPFCVQSLAVLSTYPNKYEQSDRR